MHLIRGMESNVFTKQILTGRKNKVVSLKYCSEVTFKKNEVRSWFSNMYSGGKRFIANHWLHCFSLLFCLQSVFTTDFIFYSIVLLSYLANA